MDYSTFQTYFNNSFPHVPCEHWVMMGIVSLASAALLLMRKKCSVYGVIVLWFTVYCTLFLLDIAVWLRLGANYQSHERFDFVAEYYRLVQGNELQRAQILLNFVAFVPLGYFLSEFLASTNRFITGRRIGFVALVSFCLSLCIECLQLILRVGLFEITDLVMNTLGAFVGAGVAVLIRRFLHSLKLGRNDNNEIPSLRSE